MSKKSLIIIGIILVVAVIGGGVYYYGFSQGWFGSSASVNGPVSPSPTSVPTGTIKGSIKSGGDIFNNKKCSVSISGSGFSRGNDTSNGYFEFTKVPAGSYTVSANCSDGYEGSASTTVKAGQIAYVTINLEPPPP